MKLYRNKKNEKENLVLIQDYPHRHALVNEFHTSFFSCKLMKIELRDEVEGFLSENDMQFILLHMDLTNDSCEELELYPDDFLLSVDQGTAYIQELPFATGQFDEIFTLSPQQTISGYFLYVIPSKAKKICFIHPEYDGEEISKTYKLRYELV